MPNVGKIFVRMPNGIGALIYREVSGGEIDEMGRFRSKKAGEAAQNCYRGVSLVLSLAL